MAGVPATFTAGGAKPHSKQMTLRLPGWQWWWDDSGTGIPAMSPYPCRGGPCSALVDTESLVTVLRPDACPAWIQLEPTEVQLRTATGHWHL